MRHTQETEGGKLVCLRHYSLELSLIIEMKSACQRDTCTPVFIATLFTITKTWNQPKCSSMNEWIKKMQCNYTVRGLVIHKKE